MTSRRTTSSLAVPSGAHSQSPCQPEQHRLILLGRLIKTAQHNAEVKYSGVCYLFRGLHQLRANSSGQPWSFPSPE
uniref:Putative secreted protein n=1 Tax=Ixodes scapularis TaxID=6945 RepID=A0A4D5S153_IXOSC